MRRLFHATRLARPAIHVRATARGRFPVRSHAFPMPRRATNNSRRRRPSVHPGGPTQPRFAGRSFLHQEASDHQRVHAGAEKGAHRVGGRVDESFSTKVERCIHHYGNAGALAKEPINQFRRTERLTPFSTVCGRALPSTCVTDGITPRFSGLTGLVRNMKGESQAYSRYSSATSRSIEGANGRHHSRNFTALFTFAFISGSRGSERIERSPKSARTEFHAALEPAKDFPVRKHFRRRSGHVVQFCRAEFEGSQRLFDFRVVKIPVPDKRGASASSAGARLCPCRARAPPPRATPSSDAAG